MQARARNSASWVFSLPICTRPLYPNIRAWSWIGNTSCPASPPSITPTCACTLARIHTTTSRIWRWISPINISTIRVPNTCCLIIKTINRTARYMSPTGRPLRSPLTTWEAARSKPKHITCWWPMWWEVRTVSPAWTSAALSEASVSIPHGFTEASSPSMPTAETAKWLIRLLMAAVHYPPTFSPVMVIFSPVGLSRRTARWFIPTSRLLPFLPATKVLLTTTLNGWKEAARRNRPRKGSGHNSSGEPWLAVRAPNPLLLTPWITLHGKT